MEVKDYDLYGTEEAMRYLGVSRHKLNKLLQEETLKPYRLTKGQYGRSAFLFHPRDLIRVKKLLSSQNYRYQHA